MTDYEIDFSKVPFNGKLSEEEQKEFERRALIMDDTNNPPVFIDRNGNYIKEFEEE